MADGESGLSDVGYRSVSGSKVPIIGVIEPGSRTAVEIAQDNTIGVIATEATVQSHAYAKAIASMGAKGQVLERACPLFVPLAEEGWTDSDVTRAVARDYLQDFTATRPAALVLGCTHYPILRDVISDLFCKLVTLRLLQPAYKVPVRPRAITGDVFPALR